MGGGSLGKRLNPANDSRGVFLYHQVVSSEGTMYIDNAIPRSSKLNHRDQRSKKMTTIHYHQSRVNASDNKIYSTDTVPHTAIKIDLKKSRGWGHPRDKNPMDHSISNAGVLRTQSLHDQISRELAPR